MIRQLQARTTPVALLAYSRTPGAVAFDPVGEDGQYADAARLDDLLGDLSRARRGADVSRAVDRFVAGNAPLQRVTAYVSGLLAASEDDFSALEMLGERLRSDGRGAWPRDRLLQFSATVASTFGSPGAFALALKNAYFFTPRAEYDALDRADGVDTDVMLNHYTTLSCTGRAVGPDFGIREFAGAVGDAALMLAGLLARPASFRATFEDRAEAQLASLRQSLRDISGDYAGVDFKRIMPEDPFFTGRVTAMVDLIMTLSSLVAHHVKAMAFNEDVMKLLLRAPDGRARIVRGLALTDFGNDDPPADRIADIAGRAAAAHVLASPVLRAHLADHTGLLRVYEQCLIPDLVQRRARESLADAKFRGEIARHLAASLLQTHRRARDDLRALDANLATLPRDLARATDDQLERIQAVYDQLQDLVCARGAEWYGRNLVLRAAAPPRGNDGDLRVREGLDSADDVTQARDEDAAQAAPVLIALHRLLDRLRDTPAAALEGALAHAVDALTVWNGGIRVSVMTAMQTAQAPERLAQDFMARVNGIPRLAPSPLLEARADYTDLTRADAPPCDARLIATLKRRLEGELADLRRRETAVARTTKDLNDALCL